MFDRGRIPHPGVLLGILGVVVPPGSPNPDPVLTKKSYFSHRFQTWHLKSIPVFRPGKGRTVMLSLLRLERQRNVFLKSISNSHLSLSFLLTPQAAQAHYLWVRASEVIWSEYTRIILNFQYSMERKSTKRRLNQP